MKTFVAKPHEVKRDWYVIDAKGKVLGRVASEVARRLRGKHKPEFTPHVDTGDYIVIINAAEIVVTGNKSQDKKYYRHSTYPGGITETNFQKMQERFPGRAIQKAVKGMLPKGPLGYAMRSEEHTSELQSLMRISYAVFCLKKKTTMNKLQRDQIKTP